MDNKSPDIQMDSDLTQIKQDLQSLYTHVSAAVSKGTEDAKVKWGETRDVLEVKRVALEAKAAELAKAGSAATADMQAGIGAAYTELRKAFLEAKSKFDSATPNP